MVPRTVRGQHRLWGQTGTVTSLTIRLLSAWEGRWHLPCLRLLSVQECSFKVVAVLDGRADVLGLVGRCVVASSKHHDSESAHVCGI